MLQPTEPVLTTIAYRNGIISADTQLSFSTFKNGFREKLAIVHGWIVAMAGPSFLRETVESWVLAGCLSEDVPTLLVEHEAEFDLLLVDSDASAYQYDAGFLLPVSADYVAIGSGAMLALGAMAHGASAEEAVAAAALHDKNTGGPIQSLHHSILRS